MTLSPVRLLLILAVGFTPLDVAAQDDAPRAVAVSRHLAEAEGLTVGSLVQLSATVDGSDAGEFVVVGIYEPTPDPARLGVVPREVRLHLPDLLALTTSRQAPARSLGTVNIALVDPADAGRFARDLNARLPGIRAMPAAGAAGSTGLFLVLERFHFAIALVTVVAATAFLLALTVMLVDERRNVVGVLRLIGLPVHRILTQLVIEGTMVATTGAAIGLLVAWSSQGLLNRFFQWRYDTTLWFVRITPDVAATCVAIAVPLGIAATVVTSWALLRRQALRLTRR
jgi:putative ABC transport system permease protein